MGLSPIFIWVFEIQNVICIFIPAQTQVFTKQNRILNLYFSEINPVCDYKSWSYSVMFHYVNSLFPDTLIGSELFSLGY